MSEEVGTDGALPSKAAIIAQVTVDDYTDTEALHAAIEALRDLKRYEAKVLTEYAQVVRKRHAEALDSQRVAAKRLGRSRAAVRGKAK